MRSRFQSAGPWAAEPFATSKAPSLRRASAVMHRTSVLAAIVFPSLRPPTKTIRPSTRPAAAPPSGNPVKALISASKLAAVASSARVDALERSPERNEQALRGDGQSVGLPALRGPTAAASRRSLGRNAPSIGGVVIEASPRPNHRSKAFLIGLHRLALPNRRPGPSSCGSAPGSLIRPMRLLVTPPRKR